MYTWGMLHVGYAVMEAEDGGTGSSPSAPCRAAGEELASQVVGYGVSFVPIRFECQLSGGGTYVGSSAPAYVNPATAVLVLITAGCGILAATTAKGAQPSTLRGVDHEK
ncbi:hypothetical protein [Micromonospora pisi]|uniref:hypothetical protein n=1 Tax=Micromonospora pisi TaxID=589240 RepID=UPI000EB58AF7|nr:hypothetical protein [Micromonospora pisi]